ncbi:uncharacterized protein [Periplaneta americana]
MYGLRAIGKGKTGGETLCGILNLPPPPTRSTRYNIIIGSAIENVALHNMKVAVEEAVAENDNVRGISAAFDGTWQKRGHISLNGVVTATSVDTGKNFILTWHKDIRPKGRTMCWDVSDVQNKAAVNLFPCHGMQGNQLWRYNPIALQAALRSSWLSRLGSVDCIQVMMQRNLGQTTSVEDFHLGPLREHWRGCRSRSGGNKTMSASERWRRKKAGQDDGQQGNQQQVTDLTELANHLLTETGNMDIYQESYEHISKL